MCTEMKQINICQIHIFSVGYSKRIHTIVFPVIILKQCIFAHDKHKNTLPKHQSLKRKLVLNRICVRVESSFFLLNCLYENTVSKTTSSPSYTIHGYRVLYLPPTKVIRDEEKHRYSE